MVNTPLMPKAIPRPNLTAVLAVAALADLVLYRLVSLQAEREIDIEVLPNLLRHGRILSAVFRVGPANRATGAPAGYGLRLLLEPGRRSSATPRPVEPVVQFAQATA